jgi:hypothetical protein
MNVKDTSSVRSTLAMSQQARYKDRPEFDADEFDEKFVCEGHANEITPQLYLGDLTSASQPMADELRNLGITGIINCTMDSSDDYKHEGIEYIRVAVSDNEYANIMLYFAGCIDFINKHLKSNGKVLVHCQMGASRSGSVVIAYLMKENKLCLNDAFSFAKKRRCLVSPNTGFWQQLKTFENDINRPETAACIDDVGSVVVVYDEQWCRQSCADFHMSGCNHIASVTSNMDMETQHRILLAGLDYILGRCIMPSDMTWLKFICCNVFDSDVSISYLHGYMFDPMGDFIENWGCEFSRSRFRSLLVDLGADENSPLFMASISENENEGE